MNVSLTPELERFVNSMLASGRYQSASEVFRDGLRLLEGSERQRMIEQALINGVLPENPGAISTDLVNQALEQARAKIREGLQAAERGELHDGEAVMRDILDPGKRRRRSSGT